MKFENDYIRVTVEKKQLTEEQKEAHRKKRKRRMPYTITAFVLILAIVVGTPYVRSKRMDEEEVQSQSMIKNTEADRQEDEPEESEDEDISYVETTRLASSIQEKYKDSSLYEYTYGKPVENLERDESVQVELAYDPWSLNVEYWYEIYGIYQDPELTQQVMPNYSFDESTGTLTMAPPNYAINQISTSLLDTDTVSRYEHSQHFFFDKGDGADWGNLGTLYMASYYDAETGEKRERPEVSIITLKGELDGAPSLSYSILDDGRPLFTWSEVDGAEEYFVCKANYREEKGYDTNMLVIGVTDGTSWSGEAPEYGSYSSMNTEFRTFEVSEDQWKRESSYDLYKDEYTPGVVVPKDFTYGEDGVCVIAVSKEGSSMVSNTFLISELAPNLPNATAYNTEEENGFSTQYENVEEIPAYDYVVMCDGITNMKLIDYKTEQAVVKSNHYINVDENGEYAGSEDVPCLEIPYVVEGTPFSYNMQVLYYDEKNLEKDLKFIEDREDKIRKKSGSVSLEADMEIIEAAGATSEKKIRQLKGIDIFANSALTEYLAANLLGGATYIDISGFPEAKDKGFATDAFLEAYYQNPLILGINGYSVSRDGTTVKVLYNEDEKSQRKKQRQIMDKVAEIIPQIIQEDMTDEEKELAINQYLCDTVVYDDDALANAEKNNYRSTDEEFNDSFTAYGALINGKCVCAGYAAAFKLLAEAADLDAIVVTGYLDGSLAHAWNKIKIDNEWQIVDVTNNDNEFIFNALLNLPEKVGSRVLVEDKDFMLDKLIPDYTGENDAYEYYHMTDNYFPVKETAERLAADLEKDGKATLRTDYDLNDEQFYAITNEIYEIMDDDVDLYGYYWLGVIYLTTEAD